MISFGGWKEPVSPDFRAIYDDGPTDRMILKDDESLIVDYGNSPDMLWTYRINEAESRLIKLGGLQGNKRYGELIKGHNDYFAVNFAEPNGGFGIAVYSLSDFSAPVSKVTFQNERREFSGDLTSWACFPKFFNILRSSGASAESILIIDAANPKRGAKSSPLGCFDSDLGYYDATISAITEVPYSACVLVSVHRYPLAFVYDLKEEQIVRKIKLPRHGMSRPIFHDQSRTFWAVSYDVLFSLDPISWKIKNQLRLQEPPPGSDMAWIGECGFSRDGSLSIVPRPYTGDVLGIDTGSFKVTSHATFGDMPSSIAEKQKSQYLVQSGTNSIGWHPAWATLLSNGTIIARDHLTGDARCA